MTILINKKITHELVQQLMNDIKNDPDTGLRVVFCNCPGGDVAAGMALVDYCRWHYQSISTMAFGVVASLAAVMFSCMPDTLQDVMGRRSMGKNAILMFHDLDAGQTQQDHEFKQLMNDVIETELANRMEPQHFNWLREQIATAKDNDVFLTPSEAIRTGLADMVL